MVEIDNDMVLVMVTIACLAQACPVYRSICMTFPVYRSEGRLVPTVEEFTNVGPEACS
jgi:hypothetical protein